MVASSLRPRSIRGALLAGLVATLLVVAQLLAPSASFATTSVVSGRITDYADPSLGVAGVKVVAYEQKTPQVPTIEAMTDASGDFVFNQLPAGRYTLRAEPSGLGLEYDSQYLGNVRDHNAAEWFDVSPGGPTHSHKDITVYVPTVFSGTVTGIDAAGSEVPLPDLWVWAFGYPREFGAPTFYDVTDATGHYSFSVPPGEYQVYFEAPEPGSALSSYISEWWDDEPFQSDSQKVVVGSAQTKTLDAQLELGGTISGTISLAAPLAELQSASVQLHETTAGADDFTPYTSAGVDLKDGSYTLRGLADGSYTLRFLAIEKTPAPLESSAGIEWWNDQPTEATAETIFVSGAGNYDHIDAEIQTRGSLTGIVSGDGVVDPGKMTVDLYMVTSASPDGILVDSTTAVVGTAGAAYHFDDLQLGTYWVKVSAQSAGYRTTFSGGATSLTGPGVLGIEPGKATTANVTLVKAPRVVMGAAPVLDGKPLVGQVVKARTGAWAPAPVALSYQWKRNGVAIPGATKYAYRLVAADAGKKVTVTVIGSRAGYPSVAKTSAAKSVLGVLTKTPVPTISGKAKVGRTLTVKPGVWAPSGVKLSYQWKRNGVAIPKATKPSYKLVKADRGKKITVTVTGVKSGYAPVSKTSVSKKVR